MVAEIIAVISTTLLVVIAANAGWEWLVSRGHEAKVQEAEQLYRLNDALNTAKQARVDSDRVRQSFVMFKNTFYGFQDEMRQRVYDLEAAAKKKAKRK